jgi:hypothetical protein
MLSLIMENISDRNSRSMIQLILQIARRVKLLTLHVIGQLSIIASSIKSLPLSARLPRMVSVYYVVIRSCMFSIQVFSLYPWMERRLVHFADAVHGMQITHARGA